MHAQRVGACITRIMLTVSACNVTGGGKGARSLEMVRTCSHGCRDNPCITLNNLTSSPTRHTYAEWTGNATCTVTYQLSKGILVHA